MKVHPEDIDLLSERHPAVHEACALAVPDRVEDESIGVAVIPADGAEVDARAFGCWCAERLAVEKVPEKWFRPDARPGSDRGQLNRDAVAQRYLAGAIKDPCNR